MRACIYGGGAVGSHLAVKLAQAGHEVSVIARGPHLEAIRERGLTLLQADRTLTAGVTATDDPAGLGPQDLIIVAVKATGLGAVADKLKPLVKPDTAVIFPQNGIPWWYPVGLVDKPAPPDLPQFEVAEKYLESVTPGQIVGGSIYSANVIAEPGVVRNNSPARNQLSLGGAAPDCVIDLDALRAIFEAAGIAAPPVKDIREIIWRKLFINMTGSVIALVTGNKSSISGQDPELEVIYRRVMAEGLRISAAHGFPMESLVDVDAILANLPNHKPSLLQDYELGRPMEIAEIVRAPQAFARVGGVETPSLDVLCAIATRIAKDRNLFSD